MLSYADKVLITGTGRCGTKYISAVAGRLGVKIQHERFGDDGIVSWRCATSAERFGRVLHQVRHPLNCIASLTTASPDSRGYARWTLLEMFPYRIGSLQFLMAMWLHWNESIEKHAHMRYQLERFEEAFPQWCDTIEQLGKSVKRDWALVAGVDKTSNTRAHVKLRWENLEAEDGELTERIRAKARLYGYENLND